MLKSVAVWTILSGFGLAFATTAFAQGLGGYASGVGDYSMNPYSSPPISPYLNLGVNPNNGLSNYQTLVRPMIDEREEMLRQTATLQQLQRQVRHGQIGLVSKDSKGQDANERPGAKHFMHFSHYFSGLR
jgi:hypothetical protein